MRLSPEYTEKTIRLYKRLLQLFPENRKYQKKLESYERQLDESRSQPPILITQEQYGEEWPFIVSKGILECIRPAIITFKANNQVYAVNYLAKYRGYKDLDEIRKEDPNKQGMEINKVDLRAIISKGLELCTPQG